MSLSGHFSIVHGSSIRSFVPVQLEANRENNEWERIKETYLKAN